MPTGPLIVGYDGGAESLDAIALTRLLAESLDADVVTLSVLTYAPTEIGFTEYERLLAEDERRLRESAAEELEGLRFESVVVPAAGAAHALHTLAEEREARLVVLGSTHRGPLGRVLPGSVADRLLAGGGAAVAVAPRGYAGRDGRLSSIACAYDGSPESEHALREAVELAGAAGASLRLLSVLDPLDPIVASPAAQGFAAFVVTAETAERQRKRLQTTVDRALESLPGELDADAEILDGDPRGALSERSAEFDLMVIGSRGYGPVRRVLLGGVSAAVVRSAACPVIITPRG